jgi:hypothetical protein
MNHGKATTKREGGNWPNNITCKYSYSPCKTMRYVVNFMRGSNNRYNYILNNCQDFGKAFYNAI